MSEEDDDDDYYRYLAIHHANYDRAFDWLDREFINIETLHDQNYHFNATECTLQKRVEIPIVIPYPGDIIEYSFKITGSSPILFGIFQVVEANEDENDISESDGDDEDKRKIVVIKETCIHDCNLISNGTLEIEDDGIVFFVFENDSDWLGGLLNKLPCISYQIKVKTHSFTFIDEEKTLVSRRILLDKLLDIEAAEMRLDHVDDIIDDTEESIEKLEETYAVVSSQLAALTAAYDAEYDAAKTASEDLQYHYLAFAGLFIRGLETRVLKNILSFLPRNGPASAVCKSWRNLMNPAITRHTNSMDRRRLRSDLSEISTTPRKTHTRGSKLTTRVRERESQQVNECTDTNQRDALQSRESPTLATISPESKLTQKIESIVAEKRKIKSLMDSWNRQFEKKFHRVPSEREFRSFTKDLFDRFAELDFELKQLQQKLEDRNR